MEIKKIYFDMDGVLADFERGINEICGMKMPVQGRLNMNLEMKTEL